MDSHSGSGPGREESPEQRADRMWDDMLQEVRVSQTGALIAPVAFHRFLSGHDLKPERVEAAARLISTGLALLALTIGTALLLLLRTATGDDTLAWILAALATAWFATAWLMLPWLVLRRTERRQGQRGYDR
jgi:hypothetical protein